MFKNVNWALVAVFGTILLVLTSSSIVYYQSLKQVNNSSSSSSKQAEINSSSQTTSSIQSSNSQTSSNYSSESSSKSNISLQVFFSKNPESMDDFTYTQVVSRSTDRKDVGTFVIEQLIAGPNDAEATKGLVTPLKLIGQSTCSNKDFRLNIENKVAELKFCKQVVTNGVGDDARIKTVITKSLKQFSTVEKIIILTQDNSCFGDLSGLDLCKK